METVLTILGVILLTAYCRRRRGGVIAAVALVAVLATVGVLYYTERTIEYYANVSRPTQVYLSLPGKPP